MGALKDKGLIVTGAARGIGAAAVRRFSAEGARVLAVDVDREDLEAAVGELDGCAAAVADVSSEDAVAGFMAAAETHLGRVDGGFLNAGVPGDIAMIADYDVATFDRLVAVNVRGTFLCLKALISQLTAQGGGGSIVVTASILSSQGSRFFGPYAATKHALMGLVRSAAMETGRDGIRVNAICPGYVATRLVDDAEVFAAGGGDVSAARAAFHAGVPLARYAEPEEAAALAAWLLGEDSAYATGGGFPLDGGVGAGPYSA